MSAQPPLSWTPLPSQTPKQMHPLIPAAGAVALSVIPAADKISGSDWTDLLLQVAAVVLAWLTGRLQTRKGAER